MNKMIGINHKEFSLANDHLEAVFDIENGSLIALRNKKTGRQHQGRRSLAQSFQMVVPLPERLLNLVDGTQQKSVYVEQSDRSRLTFGWENLRSEHSGTLDIHLKGVVTLDEMGVKFEMEIDNRSPFPVKSFTYPMIGDLRRPALGGNLMRASSFHTSLATQSLYPEFQNERGYWGSEYPIQMVPTPQNAFLLILGEGEGLYVGCHDTSAKERVEFIFQIKPGYGKVGYAPLGDELGGQRVNLEFSAIHFPFVQPGGL